MDRRPGRGCRNRGRRRLRRIPGEFDKWLLGRIGLKYKTEIDAFLREQEKYTREFDRVFDTYRD
jgi:hypothetical protein